ncbi:hypothetical protein ACNHKD_09735 [Methylocystis sp. JAN1]|uniref:hypothetical protein n=1 Tax=Methylocystis sp. JAN1 TaxID=3397211 RepID=UPI003FA2705B
MSPSNSNFEFTEHGAFDANAAAFFAHMAQEDAALAGELKSHFTSLSQGTYSQPAVLSGLLAAAENPSQPQSANTPSGPGGGQAAPAGSASTTGWLLEGLSIEGFRGINNQGKPLELKSCRQGQQHLGRKRRGQELCLRCGPICDLRRGAVARRPAGERARR